MDNVSHLPVSDRPINKEAMQSSPIYCAVIAECAKLLNAISQMAFNDPAKALKHIRGLQVPDELFYLKEAVLTHAVHLNSEVAK